MQIALLLQDKFYMQGAGAEIVKDASAVRFIVFDLHCDIQTSGQYQSNATLRTLLIA